MTFDVNKIIVKDLSGKVMKPATPISEDLGDLIYQYLGTLRWLEKCKLIHKAKKVEVSEKELDEIIHIVSLDACDFVIAVKDAILIYIEELKAANKQKEN